MDTSLHAFMGNPSASHPFVHTFIPNTSAIINPLSQYSTSMETLGELPGHQGFLQTSIAPHMADFPPNIANPCTYTPPPITMQNDLSGCRNGLPKLRRIEVPSSRQIAFCKRRKGLFRKAHELSVLCDAEIAILIFSPSGKLSEFASSSMSEIIKRYQRFQPQMTSNNPLSQDLEIWKNEAILLKNRLKCLQAFQRCVFEKRSMPLSINEAQSVESMLVSTLDKIRKRKDEILYKENHVIKEKLTQVMAIKEFAINTSSGWKDLSCHQDIVSTKLQLG